MVVRGQPTALISRRLLARTRAHFPLIDPHTRLLARTTYSSRLVLATQAPGPHSLLTFDIDHFKSLNNSLGHRAGDQILRAVASRIESVVDSPIVSRIGGEEFAAYLATDAAAARLAGERVLASFRQHHCHGTDVRVSAGLATLVGPASAQKLAHCADEALYSAKAAGRDRLVCYSDLASAAIEHDRDVALDGFETRTKVIVERVANAITTRGRRLFDQLSKRADVDPVTGLYSRRYLDRRLASEIEEATRKQQPITIALVDLDHFGGVNKTYGWPTGDEALRAVSETLTSDVRSQDWVARYGGEELCVVMFGIAAKDASSVLERLIEAVRKLEVKATDGRAFGLTVSVGAATAVANEDMAALIERASGRLLEAKQSGRNQLAV